MKTENEIRRMIERLMDAASMNRNDPTDHEAVCNQIDALLWVVGDRSGKPIG